MSFQRYIKELRIKNSYTQQILADKLGVTVLTIKRIEAGKTEIPNTKLLEALSTFIGKSKQEVLFQILYDGDSNYDTIEVKYSCRMYFEGWNSECLNLPQNNINDDSVETLITTYLSKKRNHEYNYIISPYRKIKGEFISTNDNSKLRNIYGGIILSDSKYRCVKPVGDIILFDSRDKHEFEVFLKSKKLKYDDIKFNVHLVLFDSKTLDIKDEWDVTGKW